MAPRVNPAPDGRRRSSFALLALLGVLAAGCDQDVVTPVTGFAPEDCPPDQPECQGDDPRIPVGVGADAGVGDGGYFDGGSGPDLGAPDLGPPPSEFLDVSGSWPTRYVFDVSDYLFGISSLADELDFVDQALRGNLDLGNAILNQLVRPLLDAWIRQAIMTPGGQRFQTVIRSLNGVAHLFEEVEARGVLDVTQQPAADPFAPAVVLNAAETWTSMYIRLIDRCPDGRQTTSPPHRQAFPDCANTPIPITSSPTPIQFDQGEVDVQVYVADFSGSLSAGVPQADLRFDDRAVELEVTKLILLAFDLAIRYASANMYLGMEDLFRQTICYEVGVEAEQLALQSSVTAPFAPVARQAAEDGCVMLLVDRVTNDVVAGIGVDIDAFEYDQIGRAVDVDGDGRADELQNLGVADTLDGRFRFVGSVGLRGEWQAVR